MTVPASESQRISLAMLMGTYLEGGGPNSTAVGDNGTSYGPYQIHLPAHPGVTAAQADNFQTATAIMLPAYQAAYAQVPESLWQTDPVQAAEQVVFHAERPSESYYTSQGAAKVQQAYDKASGQATGATSSSGGGGGGGVWGTITGIAGKLDPLGSYLGLDKTNPLSSLEGLGKLVSNITSISWWRRVGEFAMGALLILIGFFILFRKQTAQVATTAAEVAAVA